MKEEEQTLASIYKPPKWIKDLFEQAKVGIEKNYKVHGGGPALLLFSKGTKSYRMFIRGCGLRRHPRTKRYSYSDWVITIRRSN
jgi:hypothetical protein